MTTYRSSWIVAALLLAGCGNDVVIPNGTTEEPSVTNADQSATNIFDEIAQGEIQSANRAKVEALESQLRLNAESATDAEERLDRLTKQIESDRLQRRVDDLERQQELDRAARLSSGRPEGTWQ